ncbi:MAG TPA: zinc ribbon domain-containing protein [Blastocatellia bacterium]|nr:zinc ribbon domain-containing protein [Blastocatellia bacterium]
MADIKCARCGASNQAAANYCQHCGNVITAAASAPPARGGLLPALLIFGGVVLALAFLGSLLAPLAPQRQEAPAKQASAASTSAPAPPAAWHPVATFKGKGIKQTESFTIPGDEWRITWSTRPGPYGAMNFQIYVYDSTGTPVDVAANVIGGDEDSTVMRGAGTFYLKINAAQPYTVQVEAKY